MGPIVRLIGQGIGLAREAAAAHHQKSSSAIEHGDDSDAPLEWARYSARVEVDNRPASSLERPRSVDSNHGRRDYVDDIIEEHWLLDDIAEELDATDRPPAYSVSTDFHDVFESYDLPVKIGPARLPCPVIIPQRRPQDRSRGFMRAYAPVLAECDVDQTTFLKFIGDFHQASKANPIFNVINLAAFAAGFAPSVAAVVVSTVVQVVSETSKQIQARYRANTFLDRINETYFRPRGLYCLVMSYRPNDTAEHMVVDTSTTIAKILDSTDSTLKQKLKTIRGSSGKTRGEIELPDCAPLIFPSLEAIADDDQIVSKLKQKKIFVSNYLDRRAQAEYARKNPGSKLTVPGAENVTFASRYSDPNHPAANGSLISLLTGGHVNPRSLIGQLRKKDRKREHANAEDAAAVVTERSQKAGRGPTTRPLKRLLRQDILYLLIVNMPSEKELAEARDLLAAASKENDYEE